MRLFLTVWMIVGMTFIWLGGYYSGQKSVNAQLAQEQRK